MEKKITVKEYAELRGITVQAVRKAIRMKHNMPGVQNVDNFGKAHVIRVSDYWLRKIKKINQN